MLKKYIFMINDMFDNILCSKDQFFKLITFAIESRVVKCYD